MVTIIHPNKIIHTFGAGALRIHCQVTMGFKWSSMTWMMTPGYPHDLGNLGRIVQDVTHFSVQ